MYNVVIEKKVAKMLDKLPNEYYRLIRKHLLELEENPLTKEECDASSEKNNGKRY
ncbi:hypothetical protein EZS27_030977 [termite gut metagenome]|uniref:Uncharacterized protein n=1 Tax=termite gut metagenome TaxID=433724 RepID=A0A5J4QC44_9ZZZZ